MPAKDRHHEVVKRALIKAGWSIDQDQVYLSDTYRHVWIDLSAYKETKETLLLIEVKGFEEYQTLMVALIEATGKYMLYKAMLEVLELSYPLFLAIPHAAYEAISSIPSARQLARNAQLKFLIFDPQEEVIVQWIP